MLQLILIIHNIANVKPQPSLRNKAQTIQPNVEDEERVYGQHDPVLYHAASAQNAHSCCQRPEAQDGVDWYSDDCGDSNGREEGGYHQGEEGVAYYADGLEEGATSQR